MLSPIANPGNAVAAAPAAGNAASADIELPKSNLNSSKGTLVTDFYSYQSEDLYLKYKNKDGDVVEVSAHMEEEVYYHSETSMVSDNYDKHGCKHGAGDLALDPKAKDAAAADETDPTKKAWADVRAWAKRMQEELKQQQLELLKEALRKNGGRTVEAGNGKFIVLMVSLDGKTDGSKDASDATQAPPDAQAQVPAYWNAENTSDRIVHMATQFAKISGLDPKEFASKIKDAVQAGFDGAHAATGDLPGAAGKLNKDTKDLTFAKLTKWLEDWESAAYNQTAKPTARLDGNPTTEVPRGT